TSTRSLNERRSPSEATSSKPSPRRPDFSFEVSRTTRCAPIRRRNTTPPSTSPSPERDALLMLVRSRATLVRLRDGRVEGQEDDLSEPLSDRQLKGLGGRVERAIGECIGETRVDDPERCNDPMADQCTPQPDLDGYVPHQFE